MSCYFFTYCFFFFLKENSCSLRLLSPPVALFYSVSFWRRPVSTLLRLTFTSWAQASTPTSRSWDYRCLSITVLTLVLTSKACPWFYLWRRRVRVGLRVGVGLMSITHTRGHAEARAGPPPHFALYPSALRQGISLK